MNLVFIDPFEGLSSNIALRDGSNAVKFGNVVASGDFNGIVGAGCFGTAVGDLSPICVVRQITDAEKSLSVGDITTLQASGKLVYAAAVKEVTRTSGNSNLMRITTDAGTVDLMRSFDGKLTFQGVTSAGATQSDNFFFLELVIDLTAATFAVYVADILFMNGAITFTAAAPGIKFLGQSGSKIDDIYILAGTTGPYADRLGPVRVLRAPILSAAQADFTPNGETTNVAAVNKTNLSTATFNRSPVSNGAQDRFKLDTSGLPIDRPILGIAQSLLYRKTDIGARGLKSVITAAAGASPDTIQLPDHVVNFGGAPQHIVTAVPGGGALDLTALAAMEFGYEVTAS